MTKIYRTVSVKDEDGVKGRLPEKKQNEFDQLTVFDEFGMHLWEDFDYLDTNDLISLSENYTYWLEEVEMPSDDAIRKSFDKIHSGLDVDFIDWFAGAKWMLNLILNKNEKA